MKDIQWGWRNEVDPVPDFKREAFDVIERNADQIASVGDTIFHFAEVAMQETETCRFLTNLLTEMGFDVEVGIAGFPTALMATWGSGKPVIAVHSEFDALPSGSQVPGVTHREEVSPGGPGHAEGHNCGPAVAIGAMYALKQVMEAHDLPGTLKFFGVPAEEVTLPRPYFVRDGYVEDVDVAFWSHVSDNFSNSYGIRNYGLISAEFEFFGKTAHSAASPWHGISAIDAVKLMDIGWDVLREHLPPSQRSHSVILNGGTQPNVVPDYARIWYFFRDSTIGGIRNLFEKAKKVAEGAALMTGCTWKHNIVTAIWPGRDNRVLSQVIQNNIDQVGLPEWTDDENRLAREIQQAAGVPQRGLAREVPVLAEARQSAGSNDHGDITWVVPHGRIQFPSNVPGVPAHHWCAAIAAATSIAHKGEVAGAKVLAGTCLDLITDATSLARVKETFALETGDTVYEPLLPPDATPPYNLNADYMAKHRAALEKAYLRAPVKFR